MVIGEGENNGPPPRDLFIAIGLDQKTVENTLANNKVTSNLTAVIKEAGVTNGCSKAVGNLLYRVATEYPSSAAPAHRPTLLEYVVSSKIKKAAQLDGAFSFLVNVGAASFDLKEFEEACGVGVDVSVEEIESTVNAVLDGNMNAILEQRHSINVGKLCGEVRKLQPWADAKIVKDMIDDKLRQLLGEKTESDDKKPMKKKKEKPAKPELNKEYKVCRDKSFPIFLKIHELVALSTATGQYASHTGMAMGVSGDDLVVDVEEGSGSSDSPVHEIEKSTPPLHSSGKRVLCDNVSSGSKRKQVRESSPSVSKKKSSDHILESLDRLIVLSDRRSKITEQRMTEDDSFSYKTCMEKLSTMEGVSDEETCIAAEALKSHENRIFFMTMRRSSIDYWLSLRVKEFRRQE